MIAIIIQTKK